MPHGCGCSYCSPVSQYFLLPELVDGFAVATDGNDSGSCRQREHIRDRNAADSRKPKSEVTISGARQQQAERDRLWDSSGPDALL